LAENEREYLKVELKRVYSKSPRSRTPRFISNAYSF